MEKKISAPKSFLRLPTHMLSYIKKSFHPKHTFKVIIKSQLIRFHRICTNLNDVEEATSILFRALRTRGYSRSFLRAIKSEVQSNWTSGNGQRNLLRDEPSKLVPLVLTFSTSSRILSQNIKENFTNRQGNLEEFQEWKIITACRRNKNLKDFLVHASLKKWQDRKGSSFKEKSLYL